MRVIVKSIDRLIIREKKRKDIWNDLHSFFIPLSVCKKKGGWRSGLCKRSYGSWECDGRKKE